MTGPGQPQLVPLQRGAGDCAEPPSPAPSCRAVSTRGGELPRPAPSRPPCLGCWGLIARLPKFSFLPHQVPPQPVGGCSSHRMRQERVLSGRPAVPGAEVVRARGARLRQRTAHTDVHARRSVPATRPPPPPCRCAHLGFGLDSSTGPSGGEGRAWPQGQEAGPVLAPSPTSWHRGPWFPHPHRSPCQPWVLEPRVPTRPLVAVPGMSGGRVLARWGGGALRVGLRCRLPEGPVLLTSESPPQSLPPGCRLHVPGA